MLDSVAWRTGIWGTPSFSPMVVLGDGWILALSSFGSGPLKLSFASLSGCKNVQGSCLLSPTC